MVNGTARRASFINQILLLLMGIVMLYLLADFGRQLAVYYQRRQELRQIEAQVATGQQEELALEEQRDYVLSSVAAEQWARENGWAQKGEQTVVIVGQDAQAGLAPEERTGANPDAPSPQSVWWDLFFGER
jgi:hypothetical protein